MNPEDKKTLRPMFIVKPGTISKRDVLRAEKFCGVIIVECSEPDSARYSEAPAGASLDVQARAALDLMRYIQRADRGAYLPKSQLQDVLLNALLEHSQPRPVPNVSTVKK